jgi:hypothetical protein
MHVDELNWTELLVRFISVQLFADMRRSCNSMQLAANSVRKTAPRCDITAAVAAATSYYYHYYLVQTKRKIIRDEIMRR